MSRMCPVFNSGSEATENLLEEFHKLISEWDTASASGPSTSRAEGDDVDARLKPLLDKLEAAVAACVSCPVPDGGEPSKERLEPLSSTSSLASAATVSSSLSPSSPASNPSTSGCTRAVDLDQSSRQVQPAPRFCCPACRGVLTGAVILPCGDAFCKRCVRRDVPAIRHRLCAFAKLDVASWTRDPHSSVTVVGVVEKLWADDLKSVELRTKGNTFCEGQNYIQALDCYRAAEALLRKKGEDLNAVDLGALLSNVSFVLQMLRRTREAAEEAEKAVQLRPSWSKARYRLACAFMRLDQWEDAFKALVMTAVLEKSIVNLRKDFAVVFSKLLLQEIAAYGKDRRKRLPSDEAELPRAKRREVGFNSLWKACLLEAAHLRDTALVEVEKEGKYFMLPPENKKDGSGVDVSDVECALCLRIFWEPVTTPCGHTFCRSCLYQALDSSSACPLCKGSLHLVLANRVGSVTKILEAVCRLYFPEELEERRLSYVSHLGAVTGRGDEKRIPLFVCGVALPSLPCPLHVYEPRYRLMIRRCMESGTRQFGVCAGAPNGDGVSEFGTLMEIRDVHYFPDGRSVLETIGSKRFKILRVHQVDGYYLGDIELVHDEVPTKEAQISCLTSLMKTTRSMAARWFQSEVKDKTAILCELGPMPKEEEEAWKMHDGPAWVWWFLRVLPISPTLQLKFLSMMSLEKRLHGIEQIVQCVTRDRSTLESIPEDRR